MEHQGQLSCWSPFAMQFRSSALTDRDIAMSTPPESIKNHAFSTERATRSHGAGVFMAAVRPSDQGRIALEMNNAVGARSCVGRRELTMDAEECILEKESAFVLLSFFKTGFSSNADHDDIS